MSNYNYSQYSKNYQKNETAETAVESFEPKMTIEEITSEVKMESEVVTEVAEVSTESVVETVETVEPKAAVTGTVVNCTKLNIRQTPSTAAKVLTVINKGDVVEIDESKSTDDWYYVTTSACITGYTMREYVKV